MYNTAVIGDNYKRTDIQIQRFILFGRRLRYLHIGSFISRAKVWYGCNTAVSLPRAKGSGAKVTEPFVVVWVGVHTLAARDSVPCQSLWRVFECWW